MIPQTKGKVVVHLSSSLTILNKQAALTASTLVISDLTPLVDTPFQLLSDCLWSQWRCLRSQIFPPYGLWLLPLLMSAVAPFGQWDPSLTPLLSLSLPPISLPDARRCSYAPLTMLRCMPVMPTGAADNPCHSCLSTLVPLLLSQTLLNTNSLC